MEHGEVLVAAFPEHVFNKRFADPENLLISVFDCPDTGIGEVVADGHGNVCRQGPRGGGPDDEVFVFTILHRELHEDGWILLVPVFYFRVGDSGFTAGAEVYDAVSAVKKTFFLCAFQGPPRRLHVVGGDGLVGVGEVHPDTQTAELIRHDLLVGDGKVLTFLDEALDSIGLNVLFGGEAEFLFYSYLNGKAVHVIACPVDDIEALHAAEPQNRILD